MIAAEKIQPYKLLARCGRGAYGDVYIAEDSIGRRVALKTVEKSAAAREISGLQHYAKISNSGNLIRIFHIAETPDFLYYTMELADDLNPGNKDPEQYIPATLSNIMAQKKRLSPGETLRIATELLRGLQDLHKNQLVHRDIKPENILMINGVAKLSDVGLVRNINHLLSFGGTLGFIPPERLQTNESGQTREDDLYAVGKVLYCLLTGFPPEKYPQLPPDLVNQPGVREWNNLITTACNRNPLSRFRSAEEFSAALVRGRVTTKKKAIQWSLRLRGLLGGLVVAALAFWGFGQIKDYRAAYQAVRQEKEILAEQQKMESVKFTSRILECKDPLKIQLAQWMPKQEIESFFKKIYSLSSQSPEKGEEHRKECIRFLEEIALLAAEKPLPESSGNPLEDMKRSGQARILYHSALGTFLPPEKKAAGLQKVEAWEKRYLRHLWQGSLAPGKKLADVDTPWNVYVYIPPGEFDSGFTKKRESVEYPVWVSEKEILAEDFIFVAGYEPQNASGKNNVPVGFISWNDVLEYCRKRTLRMQNYGMLPPGYIVRPLTDVEWEWCMRGAWMGQYDLKKLTDPNGAGVFKLKECDEYALCTTPEILQPNTVKLMRMSKDYQVQWQKIDHLFFQSFYDKSAFRTAIAPGDMTWFTKHFRWQIQPYVFDTQDRHFELIISTVGAETSRRSSSFCSLLGGSLAVLDTPELRTMAKAYACTNGWPVQVAGEFQQGAWRWPDGRTIPGKLPPPKKNTVTSLVFQHGKFSLFPKDKLPAFICQWTKKEWQERLTRPNRWDNPLVAKRFTIDGRNFVVIAYCTTSGNFQTFIRLLGGKAVTPVPGKFRERLFEELAEFSDPVVIGGHYFFGRWRTMDLTDVGGDEIKPAGAVYSRSPYLHTLAIKEKKFCHTQMGKMFLLEIP